MFLDIRHFWFLNFYNLDVCTVHFVEFYYICPTNAQYLLTSIANIYCAFVGQIQ